ncbi:MAG: glycosyltransferase family 4 protein [Tildeniella nuda ZEHNDER 1965/U140]|jgi:glycosyltransferase involved in cell wall biosynthesis|nr:glycosyltransferase family 4 protein [Tildeniella nuda ZEHNDER 1965/U140]
MQVLHLSSSDDGGAGRAAHRLHKGLRNLAVTSHLLTQHKTSDDTTVLCPQTKLEKVIHRLKLPERLDALPLKRYANPKEIAFTPQWFPDNALSKVAQIDTDIVNLHWLGHGYLQLETIAKLNKPIVWTLHDMWAFTGGCHYTGDCDRYVVNCGNCPQLQSDKEHDLSRWVWQRKAKAWKQLDLTIVTPSIWLARCASSSALFHNLQVKVIPNGLDTQIYKPLNRQLARDRLNLPQDKSLILFGAMRPTGDPRKGFHLLHSALQRLKQTEWQDKIELVIFGVSQPSTSVDLGFSTHYLGKLSDDISLALVYAAADVFVAPSVQDNLPNTIMEAIACGTPCVAFNLGGMPDMIEHKRNGYLAQPYEVDDLAQGVAWVLGDEERHLKLCDRARQKAEQKFTLEMQAKEYLRLYQEITDKTSTRQIV